MRPRDLENKNPNTPGWFKDALLTAGAGFSLLALAIINIPRILDIPDLIIAVSCGGLLAISFIGLAAYRAIIARPH